MAAPRPFITDVPPAPQTPPARAPVLTAYVESLQRTRVLLSLTDAVPARYVEARPAEQPAGQPPYRRTCHVLTGWNPGGRPTTLAENHERQHRLERAVSDAGWAHRRCAVSDADLAWAEQAAAIIGAPQPAVLALAEEFEQYAVLRLDKAGLSVLDSADGARLAGRSPLAFVQRIRMGCPMQRAWPDGHELCKDPGGPWVSRSIAASAFWRYERRSLLSVVGCDVCRGGPTAGPWGATVGGSLIVPVSVASRVAGPQELR